MESHLVLYVIAGLLLLAEAFSPGLFLFICFAVATLITALLDQFLHFDLVIILAIDLILSTIALFTVRPMLRAIVKVPAELDPKNFGTYSEKLIDREAMVFKAITKTETGLVKLLDFDETWLAKSADGSEIGQGATVKIQSIEGNNLIVTPSSLRGE